MVRTLIAYFSRADENCFGGAMRYGQAGNTGIVRSLRPRHLVLVFDLAWYSDFGNQRWKRQVPLEGRSSLAMG